MREPAAVVVAAATSTSRCTDDVDRPDETFVVVLSIGALEDEEGMTFEWGSHNAKKKKKKQSSENIMRDELFAPTNHCRRTHNVICFFFLVCVFLFFFYVWVMMMMGCEID